jgi:hypothetical protein
MKISIDSLAQGFRALPITPQHIKKQWRKKESNPIKAL